MQACRKPIPMNGLVLCKDGQLSFSTSVFLSAYAEFNNVPETALMLQGETSIAFLSTSSFGRFYQLAVALLTAHRLATTYDIKASLDADGKTDTTSTTVGTSISASTSSLSESATPISLATGDDAFSADLARTGYGLQLLSLLKMVVSPAEIVQGRRVIRNVYATNWPLY